MVVEMEQAGTESGTETGTDSRNIISWDDISWQFRHCIRIITLSMLSLHFWARILIRFHKKWAYCKWSRILYKDWLQSKVFINTANIIILYVYIYIYIYIYIYTWATRYSFQLVLLCNLYLNFLPRNCYFDISIRITTTICLFCLRNKISCLRDRTYFGITKHH